MERVPAVILVEEQFEKLLSELTPSVELLQLAHAMFRDLWDGRLASAKGQARTIKLELAKADEAVEQLWIASWSQTELLSCAPMSARSRKSRFRRPYCWKESRLVVALCAASMKPLEPRLSTSETLESFGIPIF
jgi:hypothetical protein